ncbi:MAG: nitrite/sulfite reductase [Myxococcota bacterium]
MYRYNEVDSRLVHERVAEFRSQTTRRLAGDLSEDQFRPLRLMNGLYLQRHAYMLRISNPYGLLNSAQMRKLGFIAQHFDRGFGHFTTRQNIQFNWLRLPDVPDVLQHLAEVQMHAIQTSGNCVRNITCDPYAGVAPDELLDPRPYAEMIRQYKELHPEFMYLPRKFKIAMSGGRQDRAATAFHDIGLRATERDGEPGWRVLVGGGMGRTPRIAPVIREFLPLDDVISYIEAILRVYNLHGRRDNKFKARIKILVGDMGVEAFRAAVEEEWEAVRHKKLDRDRLDDVRRYFDAAVTHDPAAADSTAHEERAARDPAFADWLRWNVKPHRVPGYHVVYASLKSPRRPPGDMITEQFYAVADLMDRFSQGLACATYNQNICLQHVRSEGLPEVFDSLRAMDLATANIDTLTDLICCPGMSYCNLANAGSIPIAEQISWRFEDLDEVYDLGSIHINVSGCINACGHHHTGHIGILGISKRGEDYYQIIVGGHAGTDERLPARIGEILGPAVPAGEVVDSLERLLECYVDQRTGVEEPFIETLKRTGVEPFREAVYAG